MTQHILGSLLGRPVGHLQRVLLAVSFLLALASASAAQLNLAARPLYAGGNVPPMVMIDLSKDHSLHQKAYNDYTDLNNDGALDTTYNNGIDYAGYFDSYKCYGYDSSTIQGFVPKAVTTTKYCDGTTWSGNFLNWATMSRIDEVRKILYGGMRSTDNATTVLERAFLPMDAHAWAKYYNNDADIKKLVPFSDVELMSDIGTVTSSSNIQMRANVITVSLSANSNMQIGDQLQFTAKDSAAPANTTLTGWVTATSGSQQVSVAVYPDGVSDPKGTSATYSSWSVKNLTRGGLTICNVTPKDSSNLNSQNNTQAPVLRVVKGNYATWGASEKWQCNWYGEANNTQGSFLPSIKVGSNNVSVSGSSNGNRAAVSGINSSAENPVQGTRGLGSGQATGTFNARVQVCVAGLIGTENCKQYGTTYKPYGLLQKYGETGQMLFGLMTGTYDKNISGGMLRRNVTNFAQEINPDNGTFLFSGTSAVKGIVWNIDHLRPYGYSYSDGSYVNADKCNYQQTGIVSSGGSTAQNQPANEGNCSTWGNPISEIYLETLRYFAGKSPDSRFAASGSGKDATLKLTSPGWANPLDLPATDPGKAPYCSPLNTLVFNSSVTSYDGDQLDKFSDLNTTGSVSPWTNKVGAGEGVDGKATWFAGGVGSVIDNMCSAKAVSNFSDVLGICPEGPSQKGTFQIAGAALFAHMNRIRDGKTLGVPDGDQKSLKVATYAVQLATTTPKINVNVNGKTVTIMPSYQLHPSGVPASNGTLVDFKVISQTATSGKFYVNWEDSIAGGDYDQDVWGTLTYSVSGDTIKIATKVVSASTSNGQGFGYTVSGTDKDGTHFHSGILGFSYTDPVNVTVTPSGSQLNASGGCSNCALGDPETSVTYTANGKSGSQFQDPLYYAAKWGGFKDLNGSNTPDQVSEWDVRLSDGSGGTDGLPDNYFYATNPGALSAALERAFLSILQTSSAASVATNSSSLTTGSRIYQARFNGTDWSGQLLAYAVNADGLLQQPALWDAGLLLKGAVANNRNILSYDSAAGSGIPFRWSNLPATYRTALNLTDAQGQARLNWLRGDQSNEGDAQGKFRVRPNTLLGDIVNSSPQYVGVPNAGLADAGYATFVANKRNRKPMLYVGANDGMLHAFSANPSTDAGSDAGKELFAYVPSPLYGTLAKLTDTGYTHAYYVDGTPAAGDALVNNAWKTVLVGGLAAGGKGIYALDVTDPESIAEGTAASTVLWEFTSSSDADLGYTFGQPAIIKLANGKWAAVFGNGFNSTAAKGYIYIVFLDRPAGSKSWVLGTDYLKLSVDDAAATAANGIAQVFPTDINGDGTTDILYAGDLLGNLWKFDLRSTSPSAWTQASARSLLFVATDDGGKRQPITSSVDVMRNPAGGFMVLFGTGRYVDTSDPADMSTQSFYGIWDRDTVGAATVSRNNLVAQTISQELLYNGFAYRLVSQNTVTYSQSGTTGGWYLNLLSPGLPGQGERVVYNPQIRGNRIVFSTLIPSGDLCANGGTSWLMELSGLSGGRLPVSPFDVNNDGYFDPRDMVNGSNGGQQYVGGRQSTVGVTPTPTVTRCGPNKECKFLTGTSGNQETVSESAGSPTGRLTWREILH